jgi:hypothetical protein
MSTPVSSLKKKDDHRDDGKGFITPMTFVNKLPDLPFEPKFLKVPLSMNRFIEYKMGNALEKNYKYEMLPDVDVGVSLDLIDLQMFAVPSKENLPKLDPADERLVSGLSRIGDGKSMAGQAYPWLRKFKYMNDDLAAQRDKNMASQSIKGEGITLSVQEIAEQVESDEYRERKIAEVLQTFEDNKLAPIHPQKRHLNPVSALPFLPDLLLWGNSYNEVSFAANPIIEGDAEEKIKKRKHSLLKATYYPTPDQVYLGYFLKKRKTNDDMEDIFGENPTENDNDIEEYSFVREYRYKTQTLDPQQPPPYFLLFNDECVSYVPVKARGAMAKEDIPRNKQIPGDIKLTQAKEMTEYAIEMRNKMREDVDSNSMSIS